MYNTMVIAGTCAKENTMRLVSLPSGHRPILYGETPFGWRLNDDRSRLVKDETEQRLLSVVRHMYMAERLPMRGIVERLR